MAKKYSVCLSYDRNDPNEIRERGRGSSNFMCPMLLEWALERRDDVDVYTQDEVVAGISDEGEFIHRVDLIINSMPNNGLPFLKNPHGLTSWWDLEECSDPKRQFYADSDIIFHPNYNPYRWNLYPKEKASYLPLANDFDVSRYFPEEPFEYDVAFLGREDMDVYVKRRRILDKLASEFKISRGAQPRGEPSSRIISRGKLTIQISGYDNLEERFFQFGAIRPILVDYLEETDLIAERDKDYISYITDEECLEKVRYYLKHMDEAEKIGQRLIKKLKKYHTFDNRAAEVIRLIKGGKLDHSGWYLWDKAKTAGLPTEYPGKPL